MAANEPSLWNKFRFNAEGVDKSRVPKIASALSDIVPSGTLLTITLNQHGLDDLHTTIAALHAFIIPNLRRTKSLSLGISVSAFLSFLDVRPDTLTCLEALHLNLWSASTEQCTIHAAYIRHAIVLQNARNLRHIALRSREPEPTSIMTLMTHLPIPWHQLTTLVIPEPAIKHQDLQRILRECRSLNGLQARIQCYSKDDTIAHSNTVERGPLTLPYLHYVELEGKLRDPSALTRFELPWDQLTTLILEGITMLYISTAINWAPGIHHILRQCVRVEILSVHIPYEPRERSRDAVTGMIVLTQLRRLKLIALEPFLLDDLIVPALTSLELLTRHSFPTKQLSDMISRSGCSLLTLVGGLGSRPDDLPDLHSCLSPLSSLRELRMKYLVLHPQSVEMILSEHLPRLRLLECGLHPSSVMQFVDHLEARAREDRGDGTMKATLRHAYGWVGVANVSCEVLEQLISRLERVNAEYGTDFGIHAN